MRRNTIYASMPTVKNISSAVRRIHDFLIIINSISRIAVKNLFFTFLFFAIKFDSANYVSV